MWLFWWLRRAQRCKQRGGMAGSRSRLWRSDGSAARWCGRRSLRRADSVNRRTTAAECFARLTCDSRVSNASVRGTFAPSSLRATHHRSRGTCQTAPSKGLLAPAALQQALVFCYLSATPRDPTCVSSAGKQPQTTDSYVPAVSRRLRTRVRSMQLCAREPCLTRGGRAEPIRRRGGLPRPPGLLLGSTSRRPRLMLGRATAPKRATAAQAQRF